jgi:hypothetical protein
MYESSKRMSSRDACKFLTADIILGNSGVCYAMDGSDLGVFFSLMDGRILQWSVKEHIWGELSWTEHTHNHDLQRDTFCRFSVCPVFSGTIFSEGRLVDE